MSTRDDVIRIRIDTTWAVLDFVGQLALQAAEGETRAPANPGTTAIYRELAPFRLMEYAWLAGGACGTIEGVYLGFPDGNLYSAHAEIPERAVIDLLLAPSDGAPDLGPVYVYVVLAEPTSSAAISAFLEDLAEHLGHPVVAVLPESGACGFGGGGDARIGAAVERAAHEQARHLDRQAVLAGFKARCRRPDGRAYAELPYAFHTHIVEFASEAERDDFVAWTRRLGGWLTAHGRTCGELGFDEFFRPGEPTPVPADTVPAVLRLPAPATVAGSSPWTAFSLAPDQAIEAARPYCRLVRQTIDAARGKALA